MLEPSHPRNLQDSPLPPTDPATKARIQCDYAECLAQVSLFGPGRVALLRDATAMKSLEQLSTEGMTAEAQQHASTALLALGAVTSVRKQPIHEGGGGDASKLPPPHVMVSYNWDHQDVILRVVASLQGRGYLVWVDTEQMKGATVDTMALAVEGAAVVLVGVSRQYKESSNCRMEAQYALQKKKPLIPLKLVQGYEADGWLGLLLGSSMWYAMYGDTLASEGAFESRIDAVCRELGVRGRADATVVAETGTADISSSVSLGLEPAPLPAAAGLRELKISELKKRARAAGVPEEQIEEAEDSADPKASLVALIQQRVELVAHSIDDGADGVAASVADLRAELGLLKMSALKKRAKALQIAAEVLEEAEDSLTPREAIVELIVAAS